MAAGPDELRVSVVGGRERVDLVVPAAVRVAELLPELARRVGRGDPLSASTRCACRSWAARAWTASPGSWTRGCPTVPCSR